MPPVPTAYGLGTFCCFHGLESQLSNSGGLWLGGLQFIRQALTQSFSTRNSLRAFSGPPPPSKQLSPPPPPAGGAGGWFRPTGLFAVLLSGLPGLKEALVEPLRPSVAQQEPDMAAIYC